MVYSPFDDDEPQVDIYFMPLIDGEEEVISNVYSMPLVGEEESEVEVISNVYSMPLDEEEPKVEVTTLPLDKSDSQEDLVFPPMPASRDDSYFFKIGEFQHQQLPFSILSVVAIFVFAISFLIIRRRHWFPKFQFRRRITYNVDKNDQESANENHQGKFDKFLSLKLDSNFNLHNMESTVIKAIEYLNVDEVDYDRDKFDAVLVQMSSLKNRMNSCLDECDFPNLDINIELCKFRKDAIKLVEKFSDVIDSIRSMEDKVVEQSFYQKLKRSVEKSLTDASQIVALVEGIAYLSECEMTYLPLYADAEARLQALHASEDSRVQEDTKRQVDSFLSTQQILLSSPSLAIQNHSNNVQLITSESDSSTIITLPSPPHSIEEGYEYLQANINQPISLLNPRVSSDAMMVANALAINEIHRTAASADAAMKQFRRQREESAVRSARQRWESTVQASQHRKVTIANDKERRKKEIEVSKEKLTERLAALEEKRRLQKTVLLAWDSWVLLLMLAVEAAALCGFFGVVDWWNPHFDSVTQMLFTSLRVACEAFNKAATGGGCESKSNTLSRNPTVFQFIITGGGSQGVVALLSQYIRLPTDYGIDLLLQSVAIMVGVDRQSFTTVTYCMGLLLMKTMPSIFANFLLYKIGFSFNMASAVSWFVFLLSLADVVQTLALGPCRWCLVLYLSHVIYVWCLYFVDSNGKSTISWKRRPIRSEDIYISEQNQVVIPQAYDYRQIVIYSLHPIILVCITLISVEI